MPGRLTYLGGFAVLAMLLIAPGESRAAFTMRLSPTAPIVAGQSVEVTLQLVSDGTGGDIYGFSATVYLEAAPLDLYIIAATLPASNYLFQNNSLLFELSPFDDVGTPLADFPATRLGIFDLPDNPLFVTVGANETYDLAVLTFGTSSATPAGTVNIRFDESLSRLDGMPDPVTFESASFPLNFVDGQIGVLSNGAPANPVPAPPSLLLFALGAFTAAVPRLRRSWCAR